MAAFALTAEQLTINSVDYTAISVVKGAVLTVDVDQLDPTAMGDGWKKVLGGLKGANLALNLIDDMAAARTDALLWPLLGTIVTFLVRPTTAAVSATNPNYTGSILIASLSVGGQVGELAMKSGLTFPCDGAVTRATS
jgi:hypothetical protein